jgi:hypothetical protein
MKIVISQQGHSMEGLFPLAFVAFLVAVVFRIMLRSRAQVSIKFPTLGFLNLGGDEFLPLIDTDRAALAPIFSEVKTGQVIKFPVATSFSFTPKSRLTGRWVLTST